MKQNVVLHSTDRNLFGVTIRQNTKQGFLSVTDLQKSYEVARWQYGWSDKRINDILSSLDTKERIYYLLKEREIIKADIPVFMEMVKNEGLTKVLKGLGVYKTTGARQNKHVMADPYIWVLIAMELNPMIYAKVVMWLTDKLIFNRLEAGGEYMPMNTRIKSVVASPKYHEYARMINEQVFGKHISGMRNLANAKELSKIAEIEKQVITAIDMGWIDNESKLVKYLTKK